MKSVSIGKTRGIQRCSTPSGKFVILALDHRNNMRKLLHPEQEQLTTAEEITDFKLQVMRSMGSVPSAYLLDPMYSAAQVISLKALPREAGLLVALEASGYTGDPSSRVSSILPGWSVRKIKRMGADAVKLLVYYHPQAPSHHEIECLLEETAQECSKEDIPLFLEILTYPLEPAQGKLSGKERHDVVVESAQRLTARGGDVLKVEFPFDIWQSADVGEWEKACRVLTKSIQIPWILLSASVDFATFHKQVTAACRGGASGVAVGRAVWKEAADLRADERTHFLDSTAAERMQMVTEVVETQAASWHNYFTPTAINERWFCEYGG